VDRIHQAAQDQLTANEAIVSAMEQIKRSGLSSMKDLEDMTRSFAALRNEVEVLKNEIAVFHTKSVAGKPAPPR
jgi:hypothetical protein